MKDERARRRRRRLKALREAKDELQRLMDEHEVDVAGELEQLGVANPFAQLASQIIQDHKDGKIDNRDFRALGIREFDGRLWIAISPLAYIGRG